MTKAERAAQLRSDPNVHYNCTQGVFIPYAEELGLTTEQANAIGAHFGGGMHVGATCGAIVGGLMALGLLGKDKETAGKFWNEFKEAAGATDCAELKRLIKEEGGMSCNELVLKAVELVEKYK